MSDLSRLLYDLGRIASKSGSVMNDVENITKGRPDKVIKKHIRSEAHKGLNSILRR